MGFTTDNLSLYHTFSKTPVDSNTSSAAAQLGNAINKSGHTVQSNEIWTESIPFFGLAATTTAIHTKFSATAKVNDLVKDSDGKIWQRNNVEYSADVEFADLWFEKTTSITSTTKDADGNYPTADGALLDGSYLLNSEGIPTVKYYEKRLLTRLTADNNANTNSDNKASRLQIDGKWIDQFIGVTDIYVNGSAAVSYAPVLRKDKSSSPMQAGPGKGYMDYCATGLILWESSAAGTEVIDCFEYVGEKLNSTVASLSKAVFGEGGSESNDASLTQKVAQNTAAIAKLNGSATETGSVAKAVADAEGRVKVTTDALAGRIAQLEGIQHFSVEIVDTLPETPVENTIYLVAEEGVAEGTYIEYIAYKPAGSESVVTEKIGSTALDLTGYTTDAEHEALQGRVSAIEDTTVPALEQSIIDANIDAKSEAATNLATARTEITAEIAQAKSEAIASAEVTITAGTGIVVTGEGKGTTFQIAVSDDVATAAALSALSQTVASNKTELEGKITAVETALETAKTEIKGTTDALDSRLTDAESGIEALTSGDNSVAKQIETAKTEIKGQSLAQTGTLSDMFTVTTAGTVGEGISGITITDTGLAQAIADAKQAGTDAASKSLASTSTGSSLVTVTTTGTVGTGMTTTVDTTALDSTVSAAASAIQGITLNGGEDNELVTVGEGNIVDITLPKNAVATDGSTQYGLSFSTSFSGGVHSGVGSSGHYLHIAAAQYDANTKTWGEGTTNYFTTASTVESFVNATVGADLATLENKVNAYHEAGVSYKVHDSQTLPDLSVEENVEKYKNVILLVPTSKNPQTETPDESEAISGGYIEYLCVKTGETTYAWEKIGTTEADLSGYVRGISYTNEVNSHTSPVYASISSTGYLTLAIDSATSDKLGVSKLFSGNYFDMASVVDKSNTAVSLDTASQMFTDIGFKLNDKADADEVVSSINGAKGAVNLCVHNYSDGDRSNSEGSVFPGTTVTTHANLWGMGVFSNDDSILLVDSFVGMSESYLTTANLPSGAVSVENNFVYGSDGTVITTIRSERMVSGFSAANVTSLKSFVGDLSNLETSNVGNGMSTFYACSALETFIGDLSSLTDGSNMFEGCTSLTTFIGDLSSLKKGTQTLWVHQNGMFDWTNLSVESVENIADALPENPVVDTSTYEGYITISWCQLTSDIEEQQELVDALCGVLEKRWALVTNPELLTMFDTEKYQVVQHYDTVQPLDLESEPQQIAYVIKK